MLMLMHRMTRNRRRRASAFEASADRARIEDLWGVDTSRIDEAAGTMSAAASAVTAAAATAVEGRRQVSGLEVTVAMLSEACRRTLLLLKMRSRDETLAGLRDVTVSRSRSLETIRTGLRATKGPADLRTSLRRTSDRRCLQKSSVIRMKVKKGGDLVERLDQVGNGDRRGRHMIRVGREAAALKKASASELVEMRLRGRVTAGP